MSTVDVLRPNAISARRVLRGSLYLAACTLRVDSGNWTIVARACGRLAHATKVQW